MYDTYTNLTGLATGPDGNMWATDDHYSRIDVVGVSGGTSTTYNAAVNSDPTDIISGPDGNMWFFEEFTHDITKVTTSGSFTRYATASGVTPTQLAAGPDGAMWFDYQTGSPTAYHLGRLGY
jgi:virginiamycin B lyase